MATILISLLTTHTRLCCVHIFSVGTRVATDPAWFRFPSAVPARGSVCAPFPTLSLFRSQAGPGRPQKVFLSPASHSPPRPAHECSPTATPPPPHSAGSPPGTHPAPGPSLTTPPRTLSCQPPSTQHPSATNPPSSPRPSAQPNDPPTCSQLPACSPPSPPATNSACEPCDCGAASPEHLPPHEHLPPVASLHTSAAPAPRGPSLRNQICYPNHTPTTTERSRVRPPSISRCCAPRSTSSTSGPGSHPTRPSCARSRRSPSSCSHPCTRRPG